MTISDYVSEGATLKNYLLLLDSQTQTTDSDLVTLTQEREKLKIFMSSLAPIIMSAQSYGKEFSQNTQGIELNYEVHPSVLLVEDLNRGSGPIRWLILSRM